MTYYALLFARTLDDADNSAMLDWHWERSGELRPEWRRPDTGERVRWVPDSAGSISGLRWNTRTYLGRDWQRRNDAPQIQHMLDGGFFVVGDPELPPPRRRTSKTDALDGIRQQLARLERSK